MTSSPTMPSACTLSTQLQRELAGHPAVDVRETMEMGLALLDFITGYSVVVIVDSIQTGKAAPGALHELDAGALQQLTGRTPHFVGVSETLALGRQSGVGYAGAGQNLCHRGRRPVHPGHRPHPGPANRLARHCGPHPCCPPAATVILSPNPDSPSQAGFDRTGQLLRELAAFAFKPAALSAGFSILANTRPDNGRNNANGEHRHYSGVGGGQTNLNRSGHRVVDQR